MLINIDDNLKRVFEAIKKNGGRALIVGGAVRDALMGVVPKDIDVEVFKLTPNQLMGVLLEFGNIDVVGQSFGVFKLDLGERVIDFSIPRRDSKIGVNHTDFLITTDPNMTPTEAAQRRDFTINSIGYDPLNEEIFDTYYGRRDIKNKVLRCVSESSFGDDPLRVLRGMQFAGRFNLIASHTTFLKCYELLNEFDTISKERIWIEWEKWASKSIKPSRGIEFLIETHWINHFPDLGRLEDTPQDRLHHPEGGVLVHTQYVVDEIVNICERENITGNHRLILVFSALCHDFGKATTTEIHEDGRITSYGHDTAGEEPTRNFLTSINAPLWLIEEVVKLVVNHMSYINFEGSKRQVRRLATKVILGDLALLAEADHSGRPPLIKELPQKMKWMLEVAETLDLKDTSPQPILMGRHLIELGMTPSKIFGTILSAAFEAQLDGEFDDLDGALNWMESKQL